MSVYVDSMRARYGRMIMCHMIADTSDELRGMAATLGVDMRHLQHEGTSREHFDICLSKRKLAVWLGAQEITVKELARKIQGKRSAPREETSAHD